MPDETTGYEELSADIRLLGRLLGDVIRAHAGHGTFELVESVRRVAVSARRDGTTSVEALRALRECERLLAELGLMPTPEFVQLEERIVAP